MGKQSREALQDRAFLAVEKMAEVPSGTGVEIRRLEALRALGELTGFVENLKWSAVGDLRSAGVTWALIGDALGVTRSAAQQKYSA